jgi:hypothetical protein
MKPKKVEKKLFLNKKTVADLNNRQMTHLRGGIATGDTVEVCCYTKTCHCTDSCNTCYTDCDQDSCEICTLCTRPVTGCAQ